MSLFFIIRKRKLRHSLSKPSRSDFVQEEFTKQVLEAEQKLYRIAKSICIHDCECEDAVQEAILKAYEKRNTLKNEAFFQTWLVRILINQCYQQLRTSRQDVFLKRNWVSFFAFCGMIERKRAEEASLCMEA